MMQRILLALFVGAVACRQESAPGDTTQRSMARPVPSSGTSATPGKSSRDISSFPRRARQDPERLRVRSHPTGGEYIADGTGRALYSFSGDARGQSACLTNCATVWPPVIVERVPSDIDARIDASLLQLSTGPDGARQLVFNQKPLYYAESDLKPEDTWGHNALSFGGRFTLVSPVGKPLPSLR